MSAATKFLAVAIAALALIPAEVAVAADATLYELSEEMMIDNDGYRRATSSFQGTAALGTPLCPQILATLLASGATPIHVTSCTVSGVGSDKIDVATDGSGRPVRSTFGSGRLWGTFAIVVNADNMVDAPEYVVMTGTFGGDMFLTAPSEFKGKKQSAGGPVTQRIVMANGVFTPDNILGWTPEQLAAAMQAPAGVAAVEDQVADALGVGDGVLDCRRAALGYAQKRKPLQLQTFHNGLEVLQPQFGSDFLDHALGQPGATRVIANELVLLRQALDQMAPDGAIQIVLEMG